ncbi:PadR family transcriptional regulator [Gluconacetobacter entanii]|uniref:PadR family transcriptional regulator n=1 Tax=Gluconacetobacter entanii TaxID=108528 RepID=A0A318PU85_9PROT|nr:PadR family transcriptional regulator [Gluconacetobacter entanii]MCE2578241.1 PadR family transcriptional regulator [Komagataeibacter sp. FNDCR1]MBY4638895.1 PadR family transcriptional regulator [Gluconacetobacter entanii]MCW4579545.1 PadR family transcriptional regulator [Gluconacetobacter entanii]MCW4585711.1 PadR family transcriptional regulator [Gluconacetobacter entanii]PYD63584.1 PadR family transcriptional regulator [Gluconacetobacter entanii]
MKHRNRHSGGHDRRVFSPEGMPAPAGSMRHHGRGGGRHGGRGGSRGGRLFDYGEMRLLVLGLISENPTYGYELIKTIEEKFGGSYTPSPGVIYPTLTWLEEGGYIRPTGDEGRKSYAITPEGTAFLAANRPAHEEILARAATAGAEGKGNRRHGPVPVVRAMENLKTALRLRLRHGSPDPEAQARIAAVLDEAARAIEQA